MSRPDETRVYISTNHFEYHGCMQGGKEHGSGRIRYKNVGDSMNCVLEYEGEWHDGKMHGKGRQLLCGKGEFQGHFERGYKSGFGVFKYAALPSNEEIYVGNFVRDSANGRGFLGWCDSAILQAYSTAYFATLMHFVSTSYTF